MIYLDYSATTPTDDRVLKTFIEASKSSYFNPNSHYPEATKTKDLIEAASSRIQSHLHVFNHDVIYVSGATEANNLAIKGVAYKQAHLGKHLIMSPFEHSSVTACFGFLQKEGYEVDVVNVSSNGWVDLDHLASLLRDDTILVSIAGVSSELGILQPIQEIGDIIHNQSKAIFHSDMTQAIGKTAVKFDGIDLITLSGHKIYGIKGIGALIKRNSVALSPLIHGGRSLSSLRSGTPPTPLILSLEKAIDLATSELAQHYLTVKKLSRQLKSAFKDWPTISVNSPDTAVPHILNISIASRSASDTQTFLALQGILVSTQSACSSSKERSEAVYRLTQSETKALSSIRISLSHLTTEKELFALVEALRKWAL